MTRLKAFLTKKRSRLGVWLALGCILLVGAALRFQALDWDQGQYFHPDERAIVQAVLNMNRVPVTGAANGPTQPVDFPPGGLSFFIPNSKTGLRPATQAETDQYNQAHSQGQAFILPANVIAPDQPVPADAINFWNPNLSPINPHFFAYGSLPMYLMKFGGHLASLLTGQDWADWEHITLVGRFLSGLWSMGTLLLIFFLGRLAYLPGLGRQRSDLVGLAAAAFMAVTVLDIQLAHFATSDVTLTFFTTLAIYLAIRLSRSGRWQTALWLGASVGLALSSKISAAPIALAAVVAALLFGLYGESGEEAGRPRLNAVGPREIERYGQNGVVLGPRLLRSTLLNLIIAGATALLVWFVAMPYTFIDFAAWSSRVIEEAGMSRGSDAFPYTRQYVGTMPFVYQTQNLVQWALSVPLGLLALAGLAYSLWQTAFRRRRAELVIHSFLLPYSLITFSAEAKFDRYLLPVIPLLLVMAARLVVTMASKGLAVVQANEAEASPLRVNRRSVIWGGLAVLALVWAGVWALSFSQIYRSEHPMNQATRWMYANIPNNAATSHEQWDEYSPTRIVADSPARHGWCDQEILTQRNECTSVEYDMYGDAPNDTKIEYFISQLKKTDFYVINSNRLYATMPKLPWRYPIQIRFYELLFGNNLGFEKVAEFSSYPTVPLLNIPINDDTADESFTVYDHPKVLIFKKTHPLSDDEVRGLFAQAAKMPAIAKRKLEPGDLPRKAIAADDGVLASATAAQYQPVDCGYDTRKPLESCTPTKNLLLDQPVDRLPVVNDMSWNSLANDNQWLAVILWFGLIQLLGLIALPVAWRVCRRLPDRGYILAKPLGAVVVALVIWLLVWTKLVMNTTSTAWLALTLTAAFGGWLWWHNRTELNQWLLNHRRLILIEESLFLVVFVVWVLFRVGNPDLWHPYFGGEKPMEMTHLLSILRSAYFPPYDAWFADGYINYYYYGQYLVATWIKLSGISPFIAFNLAVPIIYAFTCTGAFSLIYNLSSQYKKQRARRDPAIDPTRQGGPILAGLFGVVIFAVIGNMDGMLQLLQRSEALTNVANALQLYPEKVQPLKVFDYFRSSRIIPGTINEFPAFSFIYSDLHAHLVALPYTLMAMSLAFNLLSTDWNGHSEFRPDGRASVWQMTGGRLWRIFDNTLVTPVILMIVIGFLSATNSWDLPTYLLVVGAGVFLALFRRYFQPSRPADPAISPIEQSEQDAPVEEIEDRLEPALIASEPPVSNRFSFGSLMLDFLLTGGVMVALLVGGFALYWNFFSHFQAFYNQLGILQDRLETGSYQDTAIRTISGRTEFKYFLVIFLLPLFVILSYLFWNVLDWLRSGRPVSPGYDNRDWRNEDDEGQEWEEYDELEEEAARPVQPTLPGFTLGLKRPQLALLTAGADGGSNNSGFGSPSLTGSGSPSFKPDYNRFARSWLVGLAAFVVFVLTVGAVAPNNWLVFMLSVSIIVSCGVLIFARAFDRQHPDQAAEALDASSIFLKIMLVAGFGVTAATEIVYLKDDMGGADGRGEYARMNTIFKFQYQVWALLTLAAAFGAYVVWTRWIAGREQVWRNRLLAQARRFSWIGVVVVLVFCGLLYPVQAIPARVTERGSTPIPAPTLDGRAYFKTLRSAGGVPRLVPGQSFDLLFDAQSVFEFYDKVAGTPVVLQAAIWPYRGGGSFIPINTGLPTVLGWDHHERQQRWPEMASARSDSGGQIGYIRQIYNSNSIQEALDLINHYHITYVHVGVIEREAQYYDDVSTTSEPYMSEDGLNKFEQMTKLGLLAPVYQNPGVTVFKLTTKGMSGVITGSPGQAIAGGATFVDPKLSRLEAAVKADPANMQAHYNLAQYYYNKKQYDKAAPEMEQVIKLEPNRVNPYHVLGDIYRDGGNPEKALAQYKKATEIPAPAEEIPAAFNKYGVSLQAVGQYDLAIKQFDQVVKLNPRFNEGYFHQAEIYELQGKKDLAIQAYQQTVNNSTNKTDFWARRSLQKLQELAGK